MAKVLVVEDEIKLAKLLKDYLLQAGYETVVCHDGLDVIDVFKRDNFDMVLLDLMLPGKDGLTLCKEIRSFSQVPIIMVTARVEEIDRLMGLELGADDYICKPFSPREVVARVKTVLRRFTPSSHQNDEQSHQHPIELDQNKHQAKIYGIELSLTATEFNLLEILAKEPGRIYSRSQLIDLAYQDHRIVSERTIDSHIKKLRKKLNDINPEHELIHSVYSLGYKLEV